jgi:4-diphosphocytidyl-2-C-methyl-D-erythritol kinase
VSVPAARFAAQAKVNLALHVGSRRVDGYHEVCTIFARIDLADDVVVRTLRRGITLRTMRDGVPDESAGPPETNLAVLAARAYMDEARWPTGCGIHIEKRIPVRAGLGGGSADAGGVLRALEALSPTPLGPERLVRVAAKLGADVPFLTLDAPLALGTGRGDALQVLRPLPERWLALVLPRFSIATAEAYEWLDADRASCPGPRRLDAAALREASRDWDALAAIATNDFQSVVATRYPLIDAYRSALRDAGAHVAMMSGSGSAVFGIFGDQPDVAVIARACDAPTVSARVPARVVAPLGNE